MLVLTVDIDKFFADTFQHSERNLRAIYSALVFVFRHRAFQNQHVIGHNPKVFKGLFDVFRHRRKHCGHFRPFCAVTYKSFVRALAQNKVKRVDDYRLARARFAA